MSPIEAIKEFFLSAGATWVVYLLGALSAMSVAIVVERWLVYRRRGGDVRALAERLDRHLAKAGEAATAGLAKAGEAATAGLAKAGEAATGEAATAGLAGGAFGPAVSDLLAEGSAAAQVAAAGLRLAHLGPAAADKAMKSATALERGRLERRLVFLGTVGNNAPFIGLFGTVIGIIQAFAELGQGGAGAHNDQIMSAIAEALVTTAVGIAVALPAVAAYNFFQRRVAIIVGSSEVLTNLVLAYLSATPAAAGGA